MVMRLKPQLWLARGEDGPTPNLLQAANNDRSHWKPGGGLWTSTYEDGRSEWWDWCRVAEFGDYSDCWLLEPVEARVAVVNNVDDLRAFQGDYGLPMPAEIAALESLRLGYMLDYERASQDYDALWIPNPHPWRLSMDTIWFNTMDVESTFWFRWMFDSVQKLDLPSPHTSHTKRERVK